MVAVAVAAIMMGAFAVVQARRPPAADRPDLRPGAAPATAAPATAAPPTVPPPATTRSAGTASTAGVPKKGVGTWTFRGVDEALQQSTASWYYTWSTEHAGISGPAGVEFVPMVWGAANVTADSLDQARAGGRYLLGFNEPDEPTQADMTVEQALDLWPALISTGLVLGSPAVATQAATPGGWLDRFMSGAASRGYRVDFIAVHWYGADFATARAVDQLRSYLTAVHDRYHKPIWLTEFALVDFPGGYRYPGPDVQAPFLTASTRMLAGLDFVQRYAWFALPIWADAPATGLYRDGPVSTPVGRAFVDAA
jgi:Glycosyl hydrolase catalytic core